MRTEMSAMESMRPFGRSYAGTQPRRAAQQRLSVCQGRSIMAFSAVQFFHQLPEIGGQLGLVRAQVLSQPFADRAANRSAGRTIDFFFAVLVDNAGHREFRFAL